MLDSQKNKLTMGILKNLKKKGMPSALSGSSIASEDTLMGDAEVVDEEMSPNGEMVRLPLSIKGLSSRKPKKKLMPEEASLDE